MPDEPNEPDITLADLDKAPSETKATAADVAVSMDELNAAFSRVTEENAQLKQELDETKKKVKTTEILDDLIEPYAKKAFIYMCSYSVFVGLFLLINSFGWFKTGVEASVLEFLVGSTAVTVIGLVGMVLTGIFIGARK